MPSCHVTCPNISFFCVSMTFVIIAIVIKCVQKGDLIVNIGYNDVIIVKTVGSDVFIVKSSGHEVFITKLLIMEFVVKFADVINVMSIKNDLFVVKSVEVVVVKSIVNESDVVKSINILFCRSQFC